jgi:hypothetical protein
MVRLVFRHCRSAESSSTCYNVELGLEDPVSRVESDLGDLVPTQPESWAALAALLLLVAGLVVVLEQVLAKVAAEVAPDGMDVVGVVLRVVQFN